MPKEATFAFPELFSQLPNKNAIRQSQEVAELLTRLGGPTVSAASKGSYPGGHRRGVDREDQHALGPWEEGAGEMGGSSHSLEAMRLEQRLAPLKALIQS